MGMVALGGGAEWGWGGLNLPRATNQVFGTDQTAPFNMARGSGPIQATPTPLCPAPQCPHPYCPPPSTPVLGGDCKKSRVYTFRVLGCTLSQVYTFLGVHFPGMPEEYTFRCTLSVMPFS